MALTIDEIKSVFTPKKEITNPKQFIGRYEEIKKGVDFLNTEGAFLVIYGLRGLGKSSLAQQIMTFAIGDDTLLKECQLSKFIPKNGFNYLVHIIKCDDYIKDIPTLIKRIIFGDDSNKSLYEYTKNGSSKNDRAIEFFAKRETKNQKTGNENTSELTDDLIRLFKQSLGTIRKDHQDKSGIIILIDEFDLIEDTKNFASLIKSITDDYIKFGIIGIADDIQDLVNDHASIARQLSPIEISFMNENEINMIISNAEKTIKQKITFTAEAKKIMIANAKGIPYYIHFLGQEAFMLAFERDIKILDVNEINECVGKITQGLSSQGHELTYTSLCNSNFREKMLRLIASEKESLVRVQDIYTQFKQFYGEDTKPSKYLKDLTDESHGKPALKLVRNKKFCKFVDPLFKLYCIHRERLFED